MFLVIGFASESPVQARWLTDPPLKATHFWDCSGAACDATTLKPWDPTKYRYSPMYAPLDPESYGGAKYGEKMWMTGAANDHLSDLMGADAPCCGKDGEYVRFSFRGMIVSGLRMCVGSRYVYIHNDHVKTCETREFAPTFVGALTTIIATTLSNNKQPVNPADAASAYLYEIQRQ